MVSKKKVCVQEILVATVSDLMSRRTSVTTVHREHATAARDANAIDDSCGIRQWSST